MSAALLGVHECSFAYSDGGFRLGDISLDVAEREVVGVVGPNGSGKSTLLRVMGGLLRPQAGRVTLDGAPLASFSRRGLAARVAFLPQGAATSFGFAVREVVAMGRYPHQGAFGFLTDADIAVVERSLAETDTTRFARRPFSTLSGGEKQRVLIAAVLAQEPRLMLLDEPTAALDIHHKADVFHLLRKLSNGGIAVVVVTHDLNAASQFCDRLVLLSDGRMAASGGPSDVMDEALLSEVYASEVRIVRGGLVPAPMAIVVGRDADEAH